MATTVIGDLFVRLGVDLTDMNRGFTSAENRLEKFGTQMFFLGSRITAGVTLPFTAAAGAVTKWGMDFNKALTESLAIMNGVTPAIRDQMGAVAKSVTDFSKFSAVEGAEGFYHLASAGLDAQTSMGALPVATKFAQAGVFDLAKATEFLAGAQAAMSDGTESAGQKVADMARIADVLTLANNRALGTVQDFAEALTNKAGAALRQTHKSVEEGVAVLAAYAEQNIKGKAAGQQLWMVLRDLSTYALKNADDFKRFGISVFDAQGNMRNMANIIGDVEKATRNMSDAERTEMFIALGIPLRSVAATKALIGYSDAIRKHQEALEAAGGTTDKVANEQMKALSNQVMQLWNQFKVASTEIFESFVPTIQRYIIPAMETALAKFKEFGKFVAGLPEPVKALGLALGALVVSIGPITAFIGSLSLLGGAALRGITAMVGLFGDWAVKAGLAAGGSNAFAKGAKELDAIWLSTYNGAVAAANAQKIFGEAAVNSGIAAADEARALAMLKPAYPIAALSLWTAGIVAGTAAIYEINKETGTWQGTLLALATPFAGTFALLSRFADWLGVDTSLIRDIGAIYRDAFVIGWNIGTEVVKHWASVTMGAIGGVYDYVKDKLAYMMKILSVAMPQSMQVVIAGMAALANAGPGMIESIERSMHAARLAMDKAAGFGPNIKDINLPFEPPKPGTPRPPARPGGGGGMPDVPPAQQKRIHTTRLELVKMRDDLSALGDTYAVQSRVAIASFGSIDNAQNKVFYSSDKAVDSMRELLDKSTAGLVDMQTELQRFSETSGEAHRTTLKSNLAKIKRDQDEHYRDQLRGLARVDGDEYDEYVRHLNQLKAQDEEYLRVYEAVESGKLAQSLGVSDKILRNWTNMSQAQRDQIIATQIKWNDYVRDMEKAIGVIGALGDLFKAIGGPASDLGSALSFAAQNMAAFVQAGQDIMHGDMAKGVIEATTATVNAIKAMQDSGSRIGRAAIGAEAGFQLGGAWGAVIGALAGFIMKDPGWKKIQKSIDSMWDISISKELAQQIDADSKNLGGRLNAMLAHLGEIIAAGGGLSANNVNQWAGRLSQVFTSLVQGTLNGAQAADILDKSFNDLVKVGTTTNGVVSDQISRLVLLERQYKTGSAAIGEFAKAQLGIAAGGFNKIVAGLFGPLTTGQDTLNQLDQEQEGILEKIEKLKAQISDYEKNGTKNDKQRVALMLARVNLAKQERLLNESQAKEASISAQVAQFLDETEHVSADAQAKFDRMGRLAMVTFNAMISSGMSYRDALAAVGDGLDVLIEAQKEFGLSSSDSFSQLMKLREFATVHPELMDMLDGLTQMMTGLTNTSFMTDQTFNDLGDTAADVFQKMIDGGLTADEAMAIMHPTLQLLWELEKKFGFTVDEATQALLDQAEASGTVGEQYMSANDKMVLGIDKLNKMFELFLKHLGIDIPQAAEDAANAVNSAMGNIHPVEVDVIYNEKNKPGGEPNYPEPQMATGGVLTRPTHVLAGEAGPEAIVPLDRLFDEIQAMRASEGNTFIVTTTLDGEVLTRKVLKNVQNVLSLRGV